ncbi:MAG: hypothetical protein AAB778_01970, partial [Patescibacteria group bacterium]
MKYIKYITILFFVFVLFFVNNRSVSAQSCSADLQTGEWQLCDIDIETGAQINCINTGGGGSQEAYECCLAAGTSTCEAPTGGGGGGGGVCWGGAVNCPAGSAIALDQPLSVFCSNRWGEGNMCAPIGSAQRETGCCRMSGGDCSNPEYTTYNCCAAGSLNQCSPSGAPY